MLWEHFENWQNVNVFCKTQQKNIHGSPTNHWQCLARVEATASVTAATECVDANVDARRVRTQLLGRVEVLLRPVVVEEDSVASVEEAPGASPSVNVTTHRRSELVGEFWTKTAICFVSYTWSPVSDPGLIKPGGQSTFLREQLYV